jgi:N-acetylglucosaminyl-diphospho-decaprenol L-rhamnosyltransferase
MSVMLSISIVNLNTRELLSNCLRSIYAHPPECEFEVIVVDNGSTDGSYSHIKENFPFIRLIRNETNTGFAFPNNQAIRVSKGKYHLLLNSDTIILEHTLQTLVSFAESHPTAGLVGSLCLNPDGSVQASYNNSVTLFSECLLAMGLAKYFYGVEFPSASQNDSQKSKACFWVGGTCLLARREAMDEVGLLDEGYFFYSEDLDWCVRMKQAGWQVFYCAEAQVIHLGGQTADRKSAAQLIRLYQSKARFFKKHHGKLQAFLLVIIVRTAALLKAFFLNLKGIFGNAEMHKRLANAFWQLAKSREL